MDANNIIKSVSPLNFTINEKFRLTNRHHTAMMAKCKQDSSVSIALRLRIGKSSHSEWLNELQCYLLPNFKHYNILPFLGSDKRYCNENDGAVFNSKSLLQEFDDYDRDSDTDLDDDGSHDENSDYVRGSNGIAKHVHGQQTTQVKTRRKKQGSIITEYWILNEFSFCVPLRHYLQQNTICWALCLRIMRGILAGICFLHNYSDHYDKRNPDYFIDKFLRSTNGALKKISFKDNSCHLSLKPPFEVAIIHRNLTSLNVILRGNLNACIWDFGTAYVHHPFQPIQLGQKISGRMRKIFKNSSYTPPEVHLGQGPLTLSSLKSIDMYACGIILWELMSRCIMPQLDNGSDEEKLDRYDPDNYFEPLHRELDTDKPTPEMLRHVVAIMHVRPTIKFGWLAGKQTNRLVKIMEDLWDRDQEARLSGLTAIIRLDRLAVISSNHPKDRRNKYFLTKGRTFDRKTMWPPRPTITQAPLIPFRCMPNIVFEDCDPTDSSDSSAPIQPCD